MRIPMNSVSTMSDALGDDVPVVASLGDPATDEFDVNAAIQIVLKNALNKDGVARGLREAIKAIDNRQALMCVLAEDCDEAMYKKLVTALCTEHEIPLLKVDNNKKLGEWAGLCKSDREGKARRVVRCSCIVIKDYGAESLARDQVLEYIKVHGSQA